MVEKKFLAVRVLESVAAHKRFEEVGGGSSDRATAKQKRLQRLQPVYTETQRREAERAAAVQQQRWKANEEDD